MPAPSGRPARAGRDRLHRSCGPDLVVTDLKMPPDWSGIELLPADPRAPTAPQPRHRPQGAATVKTPIEASKLGGLTTSSPPMSGGTSEELLIRRRPRAPRAPAAARRSAAAYQAMARSRRGPREARSTSGPLPGAWRATLPHDGWGRSSALDTLPTSHRVRTPPRFMATALAHREGIRRAPGDRARPRGTAWLPAR